MPCVVESGLEVREADSFEYRRAALDRLRDRGLLSEREHRRKLARARSMDAHLVAVEASVKAQMETEELSGVGASMCAESTRSVAPSVKAARLLFGTPSRGGAVACAARRAQTSTASSSSASAGSRSSTTRSTSCKRASRPSRGPLPRANSTCSSRRSTARSRRASSGRRAGTNHELRHGLAPRPAPHPGGGSSHEEPPSHEVRNAAPRKMRAAGAHLPSLLFGAFSGEVVAADAREERMAPSRGALSLGPVRRAVPCAQPARLRPRRRTR